MADPSIYKLILTRGARKKSVGGRFDVKFLVNELGYARLGYVVPKRLVPGAVRRNTIKRLIREVFRQEKSTLPAVDLIVRQIAKEPELPKTLLMAEIRTLLVDLKNA